MNSRSGNFRLTPKLWNVSRAAPGAKRGMVGSCATGDNPACMITHRGFTLARGLLGIKVLVNHAQFSGLPTLTRRYSNPKIAQTSLFISRSGSNSSVR